MKVSRHALFVTAAMAVGPSCSKPNFDASPSGRPGLEETLNAVIQHIQCEVRDVQRGKNIDPSDIENQKASQRLVTGHYVAYMNLTLDITNNQTLTPGLNFINKAVTLTGIVNLNISGAQHRNINLTFPMDLAYPAKNSTRSGDQEKLQRFAVLDETCDHISEDGFGIQGDLGLREVLLAGLKRSVGDDFAYGVPTRDSGISDIKGTSSPGFAATIDFTITTGMNGGPNWVFKDFKGPGGGNNGLVGVSRVDKNTLVASFIAASQSPPVKSPLTNFSLDASPQAKSEKFQIDISKLRTANPENDNVVDALGAARTNGATLILQNVFRV